MEVVLVHRRLVEIIVEDFEEMRRDFLLLNNFHVLIFFFNFLNLREKIIFVLYLDGLIFFVRKKSESFAPKEF